MKIEINIKKKHLYIMSIILLLTVGAIASATINPNIGWLPIQRIAKSNQDLTSLDENGNGKIDSGAIEIDPSNLKIELYDCNYGSTRTDTWGTLATCPTNQVLIGGVGCGGRYCGGLTTLYCCKVKVTT
ncbi:hypothetical protein KY330_00655 [Candidatus Woesearchaeota archaeon]|nr:hypothetical protein [Candidatus Woesearchaeota archaeon]